MSEKFLHIPDDKTRLVIAERVTLCVCSRREGEGVRVFWDRPREPAFTSRWNPFATDYPFLTFTHHPARDASDSFAVLCDVRETAQPRRLRLGPLFPSVSWIS